MDSYIVRIYRRGPASGKEAGGLVERVDGKARKAFSNRDELWAFLAEAGRERDAFAQKPLEMMRTEFVSDLYAAVF